MSLHPLKQPGHWLTNLGWECSRCNYVDPHLRLREQVRQHAAQMDKPWAIVSLRFVPGRYPAVFSKTTPALETP